MHDIVIDCGETVLYIHSLVFAGIYLGEPFMCDTHGARKVIEGCKCSKKDVNAVNNVI